MAKRRKEKEEEEYEFKLPEFDEEAFVKKEKRNIKVNFISFFFGIFIGIVSQFLWKGMTPSVRWPLIFLLGLFSASFIRYITMRLNIDVSDFGKKEWLGNFFVYFFTWLTVLIILLNPPFYDAEPPFADMVTLPAIQEPGGTVVIAAYVADNAGVENINLSILQPNNVTIYPKYNVNGSVVSYVYKNEKDFRGDFIVTLYVKDVSGHEVSVNKTFRYDDKVIKLLSPKNGETVDNTTFIMFDINNSISEKGFLPYYTVNGKKINLTKSEELQAYVTRPIYKGWASGENNTVRVFAAVKSCFYTYCFNNTVVDSTSYSFVAEKDPLIGATNGIKSNVVLPKPTSPNLTPGFETVAALIATITVTLFFMKRKRSRGS